MKNSIETPTENYLLLHIDPSRREAFLAMLELFDFVENVELEEKAVPLFQALLDNLDAVAEQRKIDERIAKMIKRQKLVLGS